MQNLSTPQSSQQDKALLRKLKAGKAAIIKCDSGWAIQADGGTRAPLAAATVRQLLDLGVLVRDAKGNYRYEQPAFEQQAQLNEKESPLSRLYQRPDASGKRYITEHQFLAGERLRADFERSQLSPRVTASWSGERVDQSNHASLSDNRIAYLSDTVFDARRRLHEAFDAVGPELAAVLYYVCCIAGGLEQAERFLELPPRSGKAILALALTRLARHYRLLNAPEPSARSRDIGHWALADYRPIIPPPAPPEPQA